MNKETTKELPVGATFWMDRIQCTIVGRAAVNSTDVIHFKFTYRDDDGTVRTGFMPVEFVMKFAGYTPQQAVPVEPDPFYAHLWAGKGGTR